MKYYRILTKGNYKKTGVLYAPESWPYPIAIDGADVENWQSLVIELREGYYQHFDLCVGGANLLSQEMKDLFASFAGDNPDIEYLPLPVKSKKYGDKTYYILHFKKIYDVMDREHTVFVEGTDAVIKVALDAEKVKDLKIFNSQPSISDVIISEDVRRAIRKNKLDEGLDFLPIYCS